MPAAAGRGAARDQFQIPNSSLFSSGTFPFQSVLLLSVSRGVRADRCGLKLWGHAAAEAGLATSLMLLLTLSPLKTLLEQNSGNRIEIRSFVGVGPVL